MASRKGSPNKFGAQVKENLVAVFNRLGGTPQMAKWAKAHNSEFYRMYAQLAPKELTADITHHAEVDLTDAQLAAIATGSGDGVTDAQVSAEDAGELH